MASTEVGESSEPLKYKIWVLKVSIHCEGCKRRVKKILQSVQGVSGIDIETKLQRVVVTGDVAAETLIKKLVKAGKHAELWPEKVDKNQGNSSASGDANGKSEKSNNQERITEESVVPGKETKPPATKSEVPIQDSSKAIQTGGGAQASTSEAGGAKVDEVAAKTEVAGGGKVAVEVKVEEKKPETGSAGKQPSPPVVEKKSEETEKTGGDITDGSGGVSGEAKKKKKKKGQSSKSSASTSPPVNGGSPNHNGGGGGPHPTPLPTSQSPPRQHGYQYPPPPLYYAPPPPAPVYAVSYNTAHPPVSSYTTSFYASPPPYSYVYSYTGSRSGLEMEPPPPPSDFDSYPRQPLDSFEIFSDENPNGCSVM